MERKLASVQRILSVVEHPNADSLDICTVLGWKVVTKRGEFSVGDLCVYCEIDSILPSDRPEFEFLSKVGYRIRTIKLRGQVSQGICFPMTIIPTGQYQEGVDVTDLLRITKYEPPIPVNLSGLVKGQFPSFLVKTDETRIQSIPEILTSIEANSSWTVTEKLDGSSMTVYYMDGQFGVCSRNLELLDSDSNSLWTVAKKLHLPEKLKRMSEDFGTGLCIQGELVGPSVQKNRYGLSNLEFRAFRMYNSDWKFFQTEFMSSLCESNEIQIVPIVGTIPKISYHTVDSLVTMSTEKSRLNPNVWQEGLVFVSDVVDTRLSFKVINPEFLLKYSDA